MSKIKLLTYLMFLTPLLMFSQKALGHYIGYNDVPESFKEKYFAKHEHNFYPKHIGDIWQYAYYDLSEDTLLYYNVSIIGDTLINGKNYFKRVDEYHSFNFYRTDFTTGTEYILDIGDFDNDGNYYKDLLSDSLEASVGTRYLSYRKGYINYPQIESEQRWYIVDGDTLLTKETYTLGGSVFYTDKLWITDIWPEQSPIIQLTGAIIDGVTYGTLVGVEDESNGTAPVKFRLSQNYPNPFNPSTVINYQLSKDSFVNLSVYNSLGQRVKVLINEVQGTGYYTVDFNASSVNGGLPSGIYLYTLTTGNFTSTKKMILMK